MKTRESTFFYGYVVVIAGFLAILVTWGTLYSFGIFFKPLSDELGWTRAATSGAYSLFFVLHGSFYIFTGRLTDKFGPRVIITICGFFLGLGFLLISQISAIWQFYLLYGVIIALGAGGGWVPLASTISRWFVKRRGLMTGIVASGIGLGTVIMPPVANWLIADYGWRTSYIIFGIIALVFIILPAQFLRRDPAQMGQLPYGESKAREPGPNLETEGFSFNQAIHTRQFWVFGAVIFTYLFSQQTITVHIVPHATDLGISAASAASILAVIGGLSIAGKIMIGSAADRIGNRLSLIISFTLLLVALFWLLAAKELWMLYLFAAVFGFAYGGIVSLQSLVTAELFGTSSLGVTFGAVMFIGSIGGAIGPVLTGGIFDITGSYYLAFLVCVVVSIIGLILAPLLKPIRRHKK